MNNKLGKSYKKVRKEDKNKKKLKTALKNIKTKTQLPKGQNLTDTNFKVKKIVIKDQVKPHDPDEVLYHKKLNVSELTARLNHHNCSIKTEALDGLRNMITQHPDAVLGTYYIQVLEAVVKLSLDDTASIRKSACKIVSLILSAIAPQKLVPVFASLNSYMLCGLTHIDKGVREDSLLLLDACLDHVPELCRKYAFTLLTVCLDLISNRNLDSRTLSLNLDSSQAAAKWRIKVLKRIHSLLHCLANDRQIGKRPFVARNSVKQHTFEPGNVNYFPVYSSFVPKDDLFVTTDDLISDEAKTSASQYAEAVIPLLLGMFVEMNPIEKTSIADNLSTVISEECSNMLTLIVGIIQSLYYLIDTHETKEMLNALSAKFSAQLVQKIVDGRFPYSVVSKGGKSKKEQQDVLSVDLNLSVARLILSFTGHRQWDAVIPFLKNIFRTVEQLSSENAAIFADCVSKICRSVETPEHGYFLEKIVKISLDGRSPLGPPFFDVLSHIALDPKMKPFHDRPDFVKWLSSLPGRLTRDKVQAHQVELISKIAARNFPSFADSLDVNVELILDNIPNIGINDEVKCEQTKRKMATLLYNVREWDDELVDSLAPAVESNYWGEQLTKYISEIISIKRSSLPPIQVDAGQPQLAL